MGGGECGKSVSPGGSCIGNFFRTVVMFPCRDSEVPVCEHHQGTMCASRVSCGEGTWLGCGSCMHVKNVGNITQFRVSILFYFMVEWMRWKSAHCEGAAPVICRISWCGVGLCRKAHVRRLK